jgi:hypothetical protein
VTTTGLEEGLSNLGFLTVIYTALLIDVRYFQVKSSLAGTYLTNTFKKFVKIILTKFFIKFKSLIIKDKSFDDELAQDRRCPNPKLSRLSAIDAVADSDDGIQIIDARKVILAVIGSYPEFPDN